jgi:hypothetical protein
MKYQLTACCLVTCVSEEDPTDHWSVYVPSRLLWSPAGMAELFRICRAQLADPAECPEDLERIDPWNAFHIISIVEDGGYIIDIDWECPDLGEE